MKRIALALTGIAALTGQAMAADMAMKARPTVAPVMTWTGFYAGINGGGAFMDDPSMSYVDGAINAISPINVIGS